MEIEVTPANFKLICGLISIPHDNQVSPGQYWIYACDHDEPEIIYINSVAEETVDMTLFHMNHGAETIHVVGNSLYRKVMLFGKMRTTKLVDIKQLNKSQAQGPLSPETSEPLKYKTRFELIEDFE